MASKEEKEYERLCEKFGELSDEATDYYLEHIQKHDNYDAIEMIQVERIDEDTYRLFYEAENFEMVGTHAEIMEELSEHLRLKKLSKKS